jgi:hypothetical protein
MRSIGIKNQGLGFVLAAALGVLALLALPGLAAARARDRNHDHIPDRWEKRFHLSLRVNQARRDQDHDGLNNRQEFLAETDPRDSDTNNNGIPDGEEGAGKIASFDAQSGELVIDLFGGGTVSGKVTEQTEIECHSGGSATASDTQGEGEAAENDEEDQQSSGSDDEQQESYADDSGEQGAQAGDSEEQEPEDGGGSGNCTTADLAKAAEEEGVVKEAELSLENGEATFEKVELAG